MFIPFFILREALEVTSNYERELIKLRERRKEYEEEVAKNEGEAVYLLHQLETNEREVEDLVRKRKNRQKRRG